MWVVCPLSVFTNLAFGFSYILFLHFLHSIIYATLLELQVKCCFISLISSGVAKSIRSSTILNGKGR